jgi:proteasome lid subunit RPN8/RPN11
MSVIIIKRHFDTIVKQCGERLPFEAGGFLGGKGNIVLGVFPVPNVADLSDVVLGMGGAKGVFQHAKWDIIRVTSFFAKYDMQLIGLYHSHPQRNVPIPSRQDVISHQLEHLRMMLIVSVQDPENIRMAAYSVSPKFAREKLLVVKDNAIQKYLNKYLIEKDIKKTAEDYIGRIKGLEKRVVQILSEYDEPKKD